jgi:electron transfer flavoprotein beta subunit
MNIFVCIKQVPDTTDVKINPETNTLIREGIASIINPFDMYAIEEGLRLKEQQGGKVVVITMGPPQAESALREAISLGVDEAILVSDRAFAGSDTWATSYTLAEAIKLIGPYDVILCGKQAIDGDTAQVGPGIATHLDIPQVTFVQKIQKVNEKGMVVERMMEEGFDVVEVSFPCLFTVVKGINTPRLPSLRGKMRAKNCEIRKISNADLKLESSDLGLDGSPTVVNKIFTPPSREGGKIFDGDIQEAVNELVDILTKEL